MVNEHVGKGAAQEGKKEGRKEGRKKERKKEKTKNKQATRKFLELEAGKNSEKKRAKASTFPNYQRTIKQSKNKNKNKNQK